MHFSRKLVIGAALTTAAMGMGVAYAQWTASGSGNGTAKAGSAQGVAAATVTYSGTTGLLYPGGAGQLQVSLHNPNTYPVKVTSVAQDTSAGMFVSSSAGAACTDAASSTHPTGVSFATQTQDATPADITLTAGQTATFTLNGVSMTGASDNGCQGATFTIPLTTSAVSTAA